MHGIIMLGMLLMTCSGLVQGPELRSDRLEKKISSTVSAHILDYGRHLYDVLHNVASTPCSEKRTKNGALWNENILTVTFSTSVIIAA